jgi:hypothetical protein
MNSFTRWLRSKQGMTILGALAVLVLIVAIISTQSDLFGAAGGKKKKTTPTNTSPAPTATKAATATKVPPTATNTAAPTATNTPVLAQFAVPKNGFTCLPTCTENDGKFLVLAGSNLSTFGGNKAILWIAIPGNVKTFDLSIFDGDFGKDDAGTLNYLNGNWDLGTGEVTYTLYEDPTQSGTGTTVAGTWKGNADNMPNNAWWTTTLNVADTAKGSDGYYYYMFQAVKDDGSGNSTSFKVKTSGFVTAGRGDLVGTSVGIMGGGLMKRDVQILYPEFTGDYNNPGPALYTGDWQMFFYVPANATRLEIWDGDFDRGSIADPTNTEDTDDPNTDGMPSWALTNVTVPERAGLEGNPKEDSAGLLWRRSPAVTYEVIGPDNKVVFTNDNPSGTEEWERFVVTSDQNATDADLKVPEIKSGQYIIHIMGLDAGNMVWLMVNQELCDPAQGCIDTTETPNTPTIPPTTPVTPTCSIENYNLGGGAAIIALNPADCQGQQNGLLFHGTSSTTIEGNAYSAGCLRSVGTHSVTVTDGQVEYIGPEFGDMSLISPAPVNITEPLPEESWKIAPPDCSDPAAKQIDAKRDWSGDVTLEPGLYCVTGDLKINNNQKFIGKGVTIYMLDGSITINGGATVQLTSPFVSGEYSTIAPALNNVLFYVPGENGNGQKVQINGNSDSYFEGVVYAPGSEIEVLGTGQVNAPYRSQFIGWDVRVGGTADVFINWKGYDLPTCQP